jgi:hypothetical protein
MAKRCLNPCEGSNQRQMKQVVLFVFPCVPKRMTPYLLSTALIPSIFVSVLTSGKWEEWEEIRVITPPPQRARLTTLRGDLMEIMGSS